MQSDRFTKVGIQRELHIDWFDQAVRLHAMGFTKSSARQEIYVYLDGAPGFDAPPSLQTKKYIANTLVKSWIAPDSDLIAFRDALFQLLQENPTFRFPIHWCLLGAAYPFWFAVAAVIGRLLNLQDQVTQTQIVSRLKERFGDRQTISRRARYVIRSFVAWGALKDSATKGCYEKAVQLGVPDKNLAILMFEAVLHAIPESKCAMGLLLNNPAFFPFHLPVMTGNFVSQHNDRIDVVRYGMDDELLKLKDK
ncbi:MAG: hypothetical protein A2512_12260 [Deltaproteobacteria bacterium RIFOXYD12_FULL_56_24]|nr:MAG: hypothetical protein A2512_12260 [Deltaproteobacteria bacterium RIFOXYD12_FULL_56_24]